MSNTSRIGMTIDASRGRFLKAVASTAGVSLDALIEMSVNKFIENDEDIKEVVEEVREQLENEEAWKAEQYESQYCTDSTDFYGCGRRLKKVGGLDRKGIQEYRCSNKECEAYEKP